MLKEERQRKSKKPWKKSHKRQENNWSGKGGRNRLSDFEEDNLLRIRKEKKKNRIDWQELLMEEEYGLNDG